MGKIRTWLGLNVASILGITQAIVKLLKEILTAVVNILFPLIPNAKFKTTITLVRGLVEKLDEIIQKVKDFFLQRIS